MRTHPRNSDQKLSGYLHAIHTNMILAIEIKDVNSVQFLVNELLSNEFLYDKTLIIKLSDEIGEKKFEIYKSLFLKDDTFSDVTFLIPNAEEYNQASRNISDSFNILNKYANNSFKEINKLITEIFLFNNDKSYIISSGTSLNNFGSIYISSNLKKSIPFYLEALVHESSHLYLFGIALNDSIVLNSDEERYSAPLRNDKRTMTGIYHAAFVISRIIYSFNNILNNNINDESKTNNEIIIRKKELISRFRGGYQTILKHGKLTNLGKEIIQYANKYVEEN
ncbi:aKG-HExxH-type peptide beta-hydroxylase [Fluviispira multicolorata]|uniref:HEXXH motif-containing protein n=1 Tax=Fluviispira multicolorata TaxID=2654512 RepID=A0A833JF01_9BACT|nr:HEXXH motif-containing putative peptide modification protein [Fluviispira multicolorata]KAB8030719.1 hypothetical protein GCL57_07025 [Fluviispira multicolorata]